MKHIISILAFSLFAVSAQAALPQVPHAALCELNADPETIQPDLVVVSELDVLHVTSVSPLLLGFINQHLKLEEYITADLDLAGIQAYFAKDEPFNELYVISYLVKSTGATFTGVTSYPGDNQYSLYFDASGKVVARAQDGDISLTVGSESIDCWSAAE
jgi:hypothetical protein